VFALALRLAIADLKAGSIGVLVLDEVLDSLDAGRQEATWAALERLTNRYNQIFVITHVDSFKDRAPHTIQV
jgi:DNA repair exonuclease SbcCD ATPase subunit